MSVNVKLGDNVINGVSVVKLESATTPGKYERFELGDSIPMDDVNFYDYDGTRVASYSASDFANLSSMPANPTHTGLTAQGWNWTLSDAKTYVAANGMLDIGQMYVTDDGKSRFYITIDDLEKYGRVVLNFKINGGGSTKSADVVIDWGDGSETDGFTGEGTYTVDHTYSSTGDYVITMQANTQEGVILGDGDNYQVFMPGDIYGEISSEVLKKIELGTIVEIDAGAFYSAINLSSITIRNDINSIPAGSFSLCENLKSFTIPDQVSDIGDSSFTNCISLSSVSIPESVSTIGTYAFGECLSLCKISLPVIITGSGYNGPSHGFIDCVSLKNIAIPEGTDIIAEYEFCNCCSLEIVKFPASIESIETQSLSGCNSVKVYDFTSHLSVPALSNSSHIGSAPSGKILVPGALYNDWIAATNWPAYEYMIVPVGEVPDNGGGDNIS
jgi:hypothetical protein